MWRRRLSDWANTHQKLMVAGMFFLMACGFVWLVSNRNEAGGSLDDTAKLLYSGFEQPQHQTGPSAADAVETLRIYSQIKAMDPDSLTALDSAFLKDIDNQLNRIIHE